MRMIQAVLEYLGSTGMAVADDLRDHVLAELRFWPLFWQVIEAETTTQRPYNRPGGWHFLAIAAQLDELYAKRSTLGLPLELEEVPKRFWRSTVHGAQKLPVTAALSFAVHQTQVGAVRAEAWTRKSSRIADEMERVQAQHPQAELAMEPPAVFLTAAAGGSTGHAGVLSGVDFYLGHRDQPLVMVFLVGPEAGATWDGYRTEKTNFRDLLLSLACRAERHPDRLWVFWTDSTADRRPQLIREVALLQADLLMRESGQELRRRLVDGFAVAALRGRLPGEPARWLCRLDLFRKEVDAAGRREALAVQLIREAVHKHGGWR